MKMSSISNGEENSMNERQQYAFRKMIQGRNLFITGQAGVGKSFTIQKFIDYYRENHENERNQLYVTSTTGISSLIIGGQTIHRFCGIGTGEKSVDDLLKKILRSPTTKKRYLTTRVLIIDEISMMSPELFDKIDLLFQRVRKCELPFGGIQIIVSGDLLQLPPVKADGFVIDSFNWDTAIHETVYLTEVVRQNEGEFIEVLNKIRLGQVDEQVVRLLSTRINQEPQNEYGVLPSRLFSKRDRVKKVNDDELQNLIDKGEEKRVFHAEYVFGKNVKEEDKEYLKTLMEERADVPDEVILTTKCQVMLKVNWPEINLANGSRGIVIGFGTTTGYPIVQFINGRCMEITPHTWEHDEQKDKIIKKQIPLDLAFAISIHKSQGSTLEYVQMDIGRDIFEYGQTYVALSRVKNLEGLFIMNHVDYSKIKANPRLLRYYERLVR